MLNDSVINSCALLGGGRMPEEGCRVIEGMWVCVFVFMQTYLHPLSLCVTVIWWVHLRVKALGVDTVPQLRCHPEKCRPFALWPRNLALEGWVSNHWPWTSASEVSSYSPGCCHKAKGYRGHSCMCVKQQALSMQQPCTDLRGRWTWH